MSESKAYELAMEEWLNLTLQERIEAIAEFSNTHESWEEFKWFVDWMKKRTTEASPGFGYVRSYVEERAQAYLASRAQAIREGTL